MAYNSQIFPYAHSINVYGGQFQSVAGDFLNIKQMGSQGRIFLLGC